MIRVLVAEDEPPLLRGICKLISNIDDRFEVVATACNGQEIIDYLEKNSEKVDLLITDICMPVKSGIDALQWIRENQLPIEAIVLTGHQEFKFAQQALQYRAVDYVLKPVNKSQFKAVLDNLYQSMEKAQQESFRQKISDLIHFDMREPSEELTTPLTDTGCENACYYLLYLCAGSYPTGYPQASIELKPDTRSKEIYAQISQYIKQCCRSEDDIWLIKKSAERERLLLFRTSAPIEVHQFADHLYHDANKQPPPFSVFVSTPIYDLENLRNSYQSLLRMVVKKMIFAVPVMLDEAAFLKKEYSDYTMPSYLKNKIIYSTEESSMKDFHDAVMTLFEDMKSNKVTQQNLERTLKEVAFAVYQKQPTVVLPFSDIEPKVLDLVATHWDYPSLSKDYFDMLMQTMFLKKAKTEKANLLSQIEDYIELNITDNLSTHVLSAKFNITSSYLAKLFKERSGYTPIEYITKKRIEKAKELLAASGEVKTKDVAMIIGYPDALYFSRIFKKETGLSPSEYRDSGRR